MSKKLSVVINTKNAESTLEKTLKSVKFADEIVVVDMHSSDKTVEIAKKYTKNIFTHKDVSYVEPARNYAIKKAKHDWILIVDADEEIPPALRKVIIGVLRADFSKEEEVADCYYIPRKNLIFNTFIRDTGWWPDKILRLFRKNNVTWSDEIHSIPITRGVVRELPAVEEIAIIHHAYRSIDQFINRSNRYTNIQAGELIKERDELMTASTVFRKFYSEFLSRYFAQNGVNDGTHGMVLSLLQGFSETLVGAKVWESQGFKSSDREEEEIAIQEVEQFKKELAYWIANYHVDNNKGLKRLIWRIRRKLFI
jgi:glycosyltransferase involved in cell wall biosynthesis